MTQTLPPHKLTITENGQITLPKAIRLEAGLTSGDELILVWAPPDTILIRKISEVSADDHLFGMAMREFDQALRLAGYRTSDDVIRLIREVKSEQVADWQEDKSF